MPRSSFVSFHYQRDHWRVQQILRMGALDGQEELPAQQWEQVKRSGDAAVKKWIDGQMNRKQAVIVLIGQETASRKFVQYEIQRAWHIKKPLLGVYIHGLRDAQRNVDRQGRNPFEACGFSGSSKTFSDYVPAFNPADYINDYTGKVFPTSTDIYAALKANISNWATQGYRRP